MKKDKTTALPRSSPTAPVTFAFEAKMKIRKATLVGALMLMAYPGAYGILRFSKYFVRQEFLCVSCSESVMSKLETDFPTASLITVESNRNQIGCGRIQKDGKRFAESVLVALFFPLSEIEMRLRGFNSSTMYAFDNISEDWSEEGFCSREILLVEFTVSRRQQGF